MIKLKYYLNLKIWEIFGSDKSPYNVYKYVKGGWLAPWGCRTNEAWPPNVAIWDL